ncbi:hypothetical protein PG990_010125 [Apiospora arundinis]
MSSKPASFIEKSQTIWRVFRPPTHRLRWQLSWWKILTIELRLHRPFLQLTARVINRLLWIQMMMGLRHRLLPYPATLSLDIPCRQASNTDDCKTCSYPYPNSGSGGQAATSRVSSAIKLEPRGRDLKVAGSQQVLRRRQVERVSCLQGAVGPLFAVVAAADPKPSAGVIDNVGVPVFLCAHGSKSYQHSSTPSFLLDVRGWALTTYSRTVWIWERGIGAASGVEAAPVFLRVRVPAQAAGETSVALNAARHMRSRRVHDAAWELAIRCIDLRKNHPVTRHRGQLDYAVVESGFPVVPHSEDDGFRYDEGKGDSTYDLASRLTHHHKAAIARHRHGCHQLLCTGVNQ